MQMGLCPSVTCSTGAAISIRRFSASDGPLAIFRFCDARIGCKGECSMSESSEVNGGSGAGEQRG